MSEISTTTTEMSEIVKKKKISERANTHKNRTLTETLQWNPARAKDDKASDRHPGNRMSTLLRRIGVGNAESVLKKV